MTLGIMQPYFMPYIGYWQLMAAVDTYVVYDDVNYIKGGWVARNNILLNGRKHLFTIALNGASPNKVFNEITIKDDFHSFLKMIEHSYKKAPYFKQTFELLCQICGYEERSLGEFIANSFRKCLDNWQIDTQIILSSTIDKDNSLKGKEKVKSICQILGADTYYNAIGGQSLYDKEDFLNAGIKLYFLKSDITPYSQFNNDFVGGLSIIDVMMFNSPEQIKQMFTQYTLI